MDFCSDIATHVLRSNYITNAPNNEGKVVNGIWFDDANHQILVSRNLDEEEVKWDAILKTCDLPPNYHYNYNYYTYNYYRYNYRYPYTYDLPVIDYTTESRPVYQMQVNTVPRRCVTESRTVTSREEIQYLVAEQTQSKLSYSYSTEDRVICKFRPSYKEASYEVNLGQLVNNPVYFTPTAVGQYQEGVSLCISDAVLNEIAAPNLNPRATVTERYYNEIYTGIPDVYDRFVPATFTSTEVTKNISIPNYSEIINPFTRFRPVTIECRDCTQQVGHIVSCYILANNVYDRFTPVNMQVYPCSQAYGIHTIEDYYKVNDVYDRFKPFTGTCRVNCVPINLPFTAYSQSSQEVSNEISIPLKTAVTERVKYWTGPGVITTVNTEVNVEFRTDLPAYVATELALEGTPYSGELYIKTGTGPTGQVATEIIDAQTLLNYSSNFSVRKLSNSFIDKMSREWTPNNWSAVPSSMTELLSLAEAVRSGYTYLLKDDGLAMLSSKLKCMNFDCYPTAIYEIRPGLLSQTIRYGSEVAIRERNFEVADVFYSSYDFSPLNVLEGVISREILNDSSICLNCYMSYRYWYVPKSASSSAVTGDTYELLNRQLHEKGTAEVYYYCNGQRNYCWEVTGTVETQRITLSPTEDVNKFIRLENSPTLTEIFTYRDYTYTPVPRELLKGSACFTPTGLYKVDTSVPVYDSLYIQDGFKDIDVSVNYTEFSNITPDDVGKLYRLNPNVPKYTYLWLDNGTSWETIDVTYKKPVITGLVSGESLYATNYENVAGDSSKTMYITDGTRNEAVSFEYRKPTISEADLFKIDATKPCYSAENVYINSGNTEWHAVEIHYTEYLGLNKKVDKYHFSTEVSGYEPGYKLTNPTNPVYSNSIIVPTSEFYESETVKVATLLGSEVLPIYQTKTCKVTAVATATANVTAVVPAVNYEQWLPNYNVTEKLIKSVTVTQPDTGIWGTPEYVNAGPNTTVITP